MEIIFHGWKMENKNKMKILYEWNYKWKFAHIDEKCWKK
jgi:hypothetical protein